MHCATKLSAQCKHQLTTPSKTTLYLSSKSVVMVLNYVNKVTVPTQCDIKYSSYEPISKIKVAIGILVMHWSR